MKTLKKKELKRQQAEDSGGDLKKHSSGASVPGEENKDPGADGGGLAAGQESQGKGAKTGVGRVLARLRSKKVLLFGIPTLCFTLIISGFFIWKLGLFAKPHQDLTPVISVNRPIPIPEYREMLDFLVLTEAGQKTFTSFRIEVLYNSPSRYQNFKDQKVVFRDTIYAFLQAQNASRNTTRAWQEIVEKDLFEYIKAKLPSSRADVIKLTQVESL